MNADAAREKLAAALTAHRIAAFSGSEVACACDHRWRGTAKYREHQNAALLPVVREIAAEELRAVAHRLDDGGDEAIEVALGGAAYVHRVLCDTAHALDGKP